MKELIGEKEGFKLYLVQDDIGMGNNDPREWDNLGTMVCFHKGYNLGDKHNFRNNQEFKEWWKENGKGGVILPLYLYDHSGITMRTGPFSCPWDSGQVGWIYATRETIIKEYGKNSRKKAEKLLEGEVKTYDQFLTGDIWGYKIENEEGEHIESCWGFFGAEYCKEEGLSMLKYVIKEEKQSERYMAL